MIEVFWRVAILVSSISRVFLILQFKDFYINFKTELEYS